MVQTIKSRRVSPGERVILLEKPLALRRIFYGIKALVDSTMEHKAHISFDDPAFLSYYIFGGPVQQLEAKGEGICQGDIWVRNVSSEEIVFVMTEILV